MVIYIDNKPYEVKEGKNLLETCLGLGFDIPYFCWHPALGSAGACRMCAVKKFRDENDTKGKIVMSCMEPVVDGLRVSLNDRDVHDFRASIIELLMTNHPHDCPVCDEGGECHLQDMTAMSGHNYRRFRFKKRTHRNQDLGPFISHEMNRCIQCYRCVRFYRDYAGGTDLNVFSAHSHIYFGRQEDGTLESGFSGNLAEVCPTGVFTDKTFRKNYTRKWDLQNAPSICTHCGVGCNITISERYGLLRRVRNRYNGTVNGYFICDRGRYGYDHVNSEKRIRSVIKRQAGGNIDILSRQEILPDIREMTEHGDIIGIGSPRASLESNYALKKLTGEKNFYSGLSSADSRLIPFALRILSETPAYLPSLRETEKSDAVLVLGEDVSNTAPMLALMLRQTFRNHGKNILNSLRVAMWDDGALRNALKLRKSGLFVLTPYPGGMDNAAAVSVQASPYDISRIGFAVAYNIKKDMNALNGLKLSDKEKKIAEDIASELNKASSPLIVSGTGCMHESVLEAAAIIAEALTNDTRRAGLFFTLPECNSAGLEFTGGNSLQEAIDRVKKEKADTLIILENDLYRRGANRLIDDFLNSFKHIIVIDTHETGTTEKAHIILPAASYAEGEGTLVNNEGRAQRFYRVMDPPGDMMDSWRWISDILKAAGREGWENLDAITESLSGDISVFSDLKDIFPRSDDRTGGRKIPRQPHRYSGRTSMNAHMDIHEQKPAEDNDSALAFSMEGYRGRPPSAIIPFFWKPAWNSGESLHKFQEEAGGALRGGDPGKRILQISVKYSWKASPLIPVELSKNELQIVPYYSIFGSDELSAFSSHISGRISRPVLLINRNDAERIRIADGADVFIKALENNIRIRAVVMEGIPEGISCYPLGFPGTGFIDLAAKYEIVMA